MEQYIPKSVLLAEIEKGKRMCDNHYSDYWNGCYNTFIDILSFIDTLEVKEVDLNVEEELKKYGISSPKTRDVCTASHFYELGLKAQKGE